MILNTHPLYYKTKNKHIEVCNFIFFLLSHQSTWRGHIFDLFTTNRNIESEESVKRKEETGVTKHVYRYSFFLTVALNCKLFVSYLKFFLFFALLLSLCKFRKHTYAVKKKGIYVLSHSLSVKSGLFTHTHTRAHTCAHTHTADILVRNRRRKMGSYSFQSTSTPQWNVVILFYTSEVKLDIFSWHCLTVH